MSTNEEEEFASLERETVRISMEGNHTAALARIDQFLGTDKISSDLRGKTLAHRSLIAKLGGDFDEAKKCLEQALQYTQRRTYARYSIELALCSDAERRGNRADAIHWCRKALETVADDATTSGAAAALFLVKNSFDGGLTPDDFDLCMKAAINAWGLFGLPGSPDPQNLQTAFEEIMRAQSRKVGQ
jgi:tetratricopeptide (TPR) repeat protein